MLKQSRSIMSLQSGKGDFPVYRGVSRQYGNGLGSIFKAALRTVIPILKPVAKASLKSVKKVAKDQGVQALKDIVDGENVKKVLKQRGKTALKSFGQSTINQLAINSTQKRKKPQSQSRHRTVKRGFIQADVIDAFNTTSRYLDDILNINNVYFDNMVSQIYPSELQLNKANASDTEAAFLDLHLSISNDIVSTKIYDKRDDFDFEIVNFPFLDGDVPRSTSYGVYISQLIRFARASSYVADFNTLNKLLTQKLLKQGYRYHKLRKTFSKFYRRYYDLISKFQVGLKSLLRQGLSEPDFYGDLVYKLKKIVGSNNFSAQFIKIISHYKKIGYNINVLQQTACLVVNPITVGNFAFLFNCTPVGRTSDSMMVPT